MVHRLRPVGHEFVRAAPVRLVFGREIAAAPERVYRALAEDVTGWAEWFGAVTLSRPLDGGAGREIRLRGGTRFRETVLVAEGPGVYAYRVDVTNAIGPFTIDAEVWYQSIGFRWAQNLRGYTAAEPQRFVRYYEQMAPASAIRLAASTVTTSVPAGSTQREH